MALREFGDLSDREVARDLRGRRLGDECTFSDDVRRSIPSLNDALAEPAPPFRVVIKLAKPERAAMVAGPMPQDSPQQAIIRGALARFPQNVAADFNDRTLALSGIEIVTIRDVLQAFLLVPAEPTPGDLGRLRPLSLRAAKKKKPTPKKKGSKR